MARNDRTIVLAQQRFMGQRAGATTIEVSTSPGATIAAPVRVAELVRTAADATA